MCILHTVCMHLLKFCLQRKLEEARGSIPNFPEEELPIPQPWNDARVGIPQNCFYAPRQTQVLSIFSGTE